MGVQFEWAYTRSPRLLTWRQRCLRSLLKRFSFRMRDGQARRRRFRFWEVKRE